MSILVGQTSPNPLLLAIIGSAVMLLWFRTALAFANKRERFLQMMTAMFGTNSFFLPAAVPLSAAIQPYFEKADPTVAPPLALMLMGTVIGIWALAVEIRIVKATFECPWIGAALLVIGEFFAAITLASLLFGGAAKAAAQT
jgi:hypothetical protein